MLDRIGQERLFGHRRLARQDPCVYQRMPKLGRLKLHYRAGPKQRDYL